MKEFLRMFAILLMLAQAHLASAADGPQPQATGPTVKAVSRIKLAEDDYKSADGVVSEGLHNDMLYSVLLGPSFYALLKPDKWSSPEEPNAWEQWYKNFGDLLFNKWRDTSTIPGQQTIKLQIHPDKRFDFIYTGKVLAGKTRGTPSSEKVFGVLEGPASDKFDAELKTAIQSALAASPPFPAMGHPMVNLSFYMTIGSDSEMFPRYGAPGFGSVTVINAKRDNIDYFANTTSAGVRLLNDGNGGNVSVGVVDVKSIYDQARSGNFQ